MTENHHDGSLKLINRILERTESRVLQHVAGGAHHEGIAQAQIENNLRRKAGVTAAKD